MVLGVKTLEGNNFVDLKPLFSYFISYILSFLYVGIYWNNHHHMLHTIESVKGKVLWANLYFLFWLSLIPFATRWMGEYYFARATMIVYETV